MKNPSSTLVAAGPVRGTETDASTRQRVTHSILEHGPSTAAALADRLGLTAAAIRRHLDLLESTGVLESREQRVYGSRGRGRPARVFALTDVGRSAFYSAYDDLAISALQYLADTAGAGAVSGFAETRVADLEARYATVLADASPEVAPAEALAAALTADGYAASTAPSAAGQQLCQHHCPVAHVAARYPQLCEAETAAFSRLLGVHVQRLATIAHGDGVCTTHIPRTTGGDSAGASHPADSSRTPFPLPHTNLAVRERERCAGATPPPESASSTGDLAI